MTKSGMAALVLLVLSLFILVMWFFIPSSIYTFNFGAQNEQTQTAAEESSATSRSSGRDIAAASLASSASPVSPATPTDGPSISIVTTTNRPVESTPVKRPASTISDDGQINELSISGQVKDEEGHPLANIEVQAEPIGRPLGVLQSAWTEHAGIFSFRNLDDREYRISVAPMEGFVPAVITARAGEILVNLVLVSLREVRLSGMVNSTEGKPLKDVQVSVGPPTRSTNTGPEGEYELDISIKGKRRPPNIIFRLAGYRDQSVPLDSADLADLRDDFQLNVSMEPIKGLTTVTGHLKDTDGNPVTGKIINMRSAKLRNGFRAQSDVKGNFTMEDVEPGHDYLLTVRPGADYRDYERARLRIPAGGLKLDVVLEPLAQGELSGWMTDVDGNPIPGFALTLHSKLSTGHSVKVVGDHQGFFAVEDFPEGSAVLKTKSFPIFETKGIRVFSVPEEPVSVVLDVGPHALLGQVTNSFGNTVAAVNLTLGWEYGENGLKNYSARQTTADINGNFAFAGLGFGAHTLRVNAPGFSTAIITVNVGMDPDNIVVKLEEKT